MDKIQITLLSIILGLFSIIVVYYIQNFELKSTKKNTFLIIGCNNSGKTLLFNKLTQKPITSTVSSLEANYGTIHLPLSQASIGKPFQLIDYPGYLKYENVFRSLVSEINLKGVIFVVDSEISSFNKQINLICVKLFRMLTITESVPNGVDYLMAVNKTDLFNSLPISKIKSSLEAEMNKVIESELKNNEDDLTFWLDYMPFSFERTNGNIEFKTGSVLKDKYSDWTNWLDERVVNP
ncbi:hypothetical protein CANTEDRAFT_104882 [Yamadazyma tenuis ATCC 10573]|uniref:Signal recognition particle receptor subunit beta n=1 Tax=Candida tenuis (strain ATCC 10573 / BCRC 21748 / CBS 615 / JCM 9827 / NBRC 10315 / NRRL Y-1498 / VKM Y-70) TaxID=590646 RepID=G3B4D9_CANTC|nr:uncharacterized protein CANTEDRAFT_104882 [Yamadazyma tenuis ATCC 10573]EGV63800.1 hypothetical protein CANTEDRAFT_104882 [Yamadazyma tenuis ATCC 10573]